jgi:hypothetical protein
MFLLPNGNKIDTEGVMDALDDSVSKTLYFLDTDNGEVGCVNASDTKTTLKLKGNRKYLEVQKIPNHLQVVWIKEFAETILKKGSKKEKILYKNLNKILAENKSDAVERSLAIMENSDESLVSGWEQWRDDSVFEEMKKWFGTLSIEIEEKFRGECDCELCKLMEKGEHTVGDFNEALQKQKKKGSDIIDLPVGAFVPLFKLFPEEAELKTRKIALVQDTFGLSKGLYILVENYCADLKCDCRKVMINVVKIGDKQIVLGTIGFGWEDAKYYTEWMGGDESVGRQMVGAYIEPGGIQTGLEDECLKLVENSLRDTYYVDLIKKRYEIFKKH